MDNGNFNQYGNGNGGNGNRGGNNNNGNRNGGSGDQNPKRQNTLLLLVAALVTLLCMSFFMKIMNDATNQEISYNEFIEMVGKGKVESVEIGTDKLTIYPVPEEEDQKEGLLQQATPPVTYYTGKIEDDDTLTQRLLEHNVKVSGDIPDNSSLLFSSERRT